MLDTDNVIIFKLETNRLQIEYIHWDTSNALEKDRRVDGYRVKT